MDTVLIIVDHGYVILMDILGKVEPEVLFLGGALAGGL